MTAAIDLRVNVSCDLHDNFPNGKNVSKNLRNKSNYLSRMQYLIHSNSIKTQDDENIGTNLKKNPATVMRDKFLVFSPFDTLA